MTGSTRRRCSTRTRTGTRRTSSARARSSSSSYETGQSIKGVRNPDYYHKGLPYLDGFIGIYAPKQAVRLDAIRADRAAIEFRGFPPSACDELKEELGDKIAVQESDWNCGSADLVQPPEEAVRRRAGAPRADPGDRPLGQRARLCRRSRIVQTVGGIVFPGSPLAPTKEELQQIAGFWPDIEKSRAEARRLLKEAGAEGAHLRAAQPQRRSALQIQRHLGWSISGARSASRSTQSVLPTGPWFAAMRSGDFDVGLAGNCQSIVNPLLDVQTYLPQLGQPANYGYYEDPKRDRDLREDAARDRPARSSAS